MIVIWVWMGVTGLVLIVALVLSIVAVNDNEQSKKQLCHLEEQINFLKIKTNWNPPSVKALAAELEKSIDSYKPRCPNCQVIIVEKPKFCRHCGHVFNKVLPPPRILATYVQSHSPYANRATAPYAFVDWQCLQCDQEQKRKWKCSSLKNRRPFISVLTCEQCQKDMGDVIIDPKLLELNRTWALDLSPHGALKLTDYQPVYPGIAASISAVATKTLEGMAEKG